MDIMQIVNSVGVGNIIGTVIIIVLFIYGIKYKHNKSDGE